MTRELAQLGPYFFCAVGLCAVLVPVTTWVAQRLGIVAVPAGRHVHQFATPRIGGLAIAASFFVTMTFMVVTVPYRWLEVLNLSQQQL
ncbi:MAG: hypothetical protein JSU68_05290, partial [Phycisphaerales bacterium]